MEFFTNGTTFIRDIYDSFSRGLLENLIGENYPLVCKTVTQLKLIKWRFVDRFTLLNLVTVERSIFSS
jgi:hypothetical protein